MGPSHKIHLDFIATTKCNEWATPLGNLSIDHETIQELTSIDNGSLFKQIERKLEENEHSLEMHIPFIRAVFKNDVKLVPLMVGHIPSKSY